MLICQPPLSYELVQTDLLKPFKDKCRWHDLPERLGSLRNGTTLMQLKNIYLQPMRWLSLFLLLLSPALFAQNKSATVTGILLDDNEKPISQASILILGRSSGIFSNDSGRFSIKLPAEKALALIFSHTGYTSVQKNFLLSNGETEQVVIRMKLAGKTLESVIITDERDRRENSLVRINPKNAITLPSTTGGIEALIKTYVGSNNELTSQYNVRGGNYDENLIYINDFEIFRPYLVSSGQQEGLSLINPALVKNVNFYTGGFQAKYGDKMSSVLDIQYKKPAAFAGSAYASLLEQGAHIEGSAKKGNITYLFGARNRSNRNLLSSQPTLGAYTPSSSDLQAFLGYRINNKWQLELLGIRSVSSFSYIPESVKKTSSVFSPFYSASIGLDIYFDGQEKDRYASMLIGASLIHQPVSKLRMKWMMSLFTDDEKENYDIGGAYLFGNRDFDNTSSTFGEIINPLGAGYYQQYARNRLKIQLWNATHKGSLETGRHFLQWGNSLELAWIEDRVRQFEYQDSAGYSLPYQPGNLSLFQSVNGRSDLDILRVSGYVQDNILLPVRNSQVTLQAGLRYHYNDLNKEFLISPRIQASWKPSWKQDIVFRAAAGIYNQPPFYRELRRPDGSLNTDILSQKSMQFVAGFDYKFRGPGDRPFRLSTEAYYKLMHDVVPYDIDNVKIKYLGSNNANAYATGIEFRLFGELVQDAESWLSIGFMRTGENLDNDYYYEYRNAAGEIIGPSTTDQVATDSSRRDVGYVRRPTDRRITVGLYLEDYLPTNKNFKVHLNMLYGTNMPFNIPNSSRYRNGLIIDPYIRIDMGFSVLLLSEKSARRSHSPFRKFDNIWASLEVFNLINRQNTISYQLVKDFSNNTFAIPNRLTPRLVNLKLVARF